MSGPPRSRVFIGDVHGCADELQDLLSTLRYDPATQALHFVGDLVNRGPKSLQTLRDVVRLEAESVVGNHELHLLARAAGHRQRAPLDTLDELLAAPDLDALLDWIRARPVLRLWPDLVLVHAGLPPSWTDLEAEADRINSIGAVSDGSGHPDVDFLVSVRCCDHQGNMIHGALATADEVSETAYGTPDTAPPREALRPWYDLYRGDRTVVFGHWADAGLVNAERLRGLDTGCVWGGRLTAWIAEEDRFVSVEAKQQYQKP